MTWQPIVLFGFAGFLGAGAFSTWKNSKVAAVILAVVAIGCAVGGVLWLTG